MSPDNFETVVKGVINSLQNWLE